MIRSLVVADSSPINILLRIGQIQLLPALFSQVIVPPEVVAELRHDRAPAIVRSFALSPPGWLIERPCEHLLTIETLDPGETAAISLAIELDALLAIDERSGRRAARAHGVIVIGVVGLLELAAGRGLIPDLSAAFDAIRETDFRVSEQLLRESLARHRERARET